MVWERRCHRSVCLDGVVVNDYAAYGPTNVAATATRPDGDGGVGGMKNGISGGSSTDRDNDDQDADGDRCRRPCPRRAATAVMMMTIAAKGGCKATARQLQGDDEATEM
jgi:hypothetical protein